MGGHNEVTLDRDRAFDVNSLNELLTQGKSILNAAISISQKMETSISAISGVYSGINGDYKVEVLGSDITDLSGTLEKDIYQDTIDRMEKIITKLISDMPTYDNSLAQSMSSIQEVLDSVNGRIGEMRGLLETGDVNLSYEDFTQRLKDLKTGWDETTEDLADLLAEIENDMLGVSVTAVQYSSDPVNLSTGNFVYDHEDMRISGEIPLSFHRYYNSKDRIKGSMGRCFVHNYESHLEENVEKGKITISMGDGQKKTFRKMEDGTYQSLYSATETLTKEGNSHILTKLAGERITYNEAGQMIRRENGYGRGITFSYHETGKLEKAETDNHTFLTYNYNEAGQLVQVTDHTGRTVKLSYERGKLSTVETPQGSRYVYHYGKNGRIAESINPRGYVSVKNTYDEKRRITRQEFPDGGHMEYAYDDKKRQVILTERNGSKITYVHDSKYRNTDILYEDGTKEHFEYNGKNQRILYVDRNGNVTKYAYDNRGNLTQYATAGGVKVTATYNADNKLLILKENGKEKLRNHYDRNGNLTESVGADGYGRQYVYNGYGQPVCITNPDGTKVDIAYDDRGNIETIHNADNSTVTYRYDALNRVIVTIDGNGNETSYVYGENDHIIETTNPLGNKRIYKYNQSGKITKVTDYDGYTIEASYNEMGKISQCMDKEGNVTKLYYDPMWHINRVIQADGGELHYQYDANDRLGEIKLPNEGKIQYHYDGNGNCTEVVQEDGSRKIFLYDVSNRLIQETGEMGASTYYTYDKAGNLTCVTDALGNKTSYGYDEMNRCTKKTDALGNVTSYQYDCMGNLTGIQYPDGSEENYRYQAGRLVEKKRRDGSFLRYTYDKNGNCTGMENAAGEKIIMLYDGLNQKIQVTNPDGGIIRYVYDSVGNVTEVTDGKGNKTHYTYTPNGNLESVTDALGHVTRYAYDKMGHLAQVERVGDMVNNQEPLIQRTLYEWDLAGNITKITNPLGDDEYFDYDIRNQLIKKTDREGNQTKFTYRADGLLQDILYGDGTKATHQYDALKRLEEVKDITGTIRIERDALGRVQSVTDASGKITGYEWGSMNERLGLQYPDGSYAGYQYNSQGQLEVLHMEKGDITYTYDTVGRLQEKLFPNGVKTEYIYNQNGQISEIRHTGKEIEERYRYQYDMAGNKTDVIKNRAEGDSGHYRYEYDALNQLTGVIRDGNRLRDYTYDAFGNRSRMEDYEQHTNTIYQYNVNNQILIRETNGVKRNYHYDKRGNLTAVFQGEKRMKQFQFDAANRMTASSQLEGGILKQAAYQYNAFGKRTGQTLYTMENQEHMPESILPKDPEREIVYTLDMTREYYDLLGYEDAVSGKEQTFYWDSNVVSMKEEGEDIYYLQDDLGSPMHLLDEEGRSKASYGYGEFGEEKQFFGDAGFQPFGYTGYQKEEAGGLYYAQARRYDANTGRFISEDKIKGFITMPVTLNAYGYCWGNPMGYVDVDGRSPVVSDIVKKIYSNGVAQYKNWAKEKNGTATFKISANATALLGVYADIGVSVDWKGNISLQISYALIGVDDTSSAGLLDAGASLGLMFTDAKNTSELIGKSSTIGASGGYLGYATVDAISFEEMEDMSGDMDGFQIGLGGGVGVDIHMMESNTKEIYTFNLFQTIGNVLENFSGESRLECEN